MTRGEVYGKITCRKLIVNNGGRFGGNVEVLNAEPNHS
jgi:cytoskeletal protein CcmA (bactofilin family)